MNVDVFVINLPHRSDRKQLCLREIAELGFNGNLVRVIEGQYTPRNGAIGCAATHAFGLSRFLFESDASLCLVVEDDFAVDDKSAFRQSLAGVLTQPDEWDVLLVASKQAVPISATRFPNVYRVVNAQTTSAYLVTRKYAPTLIRVFYEAANNLSSAFLSLDDAPLRHLFALDMAWKPLQTTDCFLAFLPQLSYQRESYSDVLNANRASK
jgi:GR25 family glycosyltransferase involved in LPS biosynthesis